MHFTVLLSFFPPSSCEMAQLVIPQYLHHLNVFAVQGEVCVNALQRGGWFNQPIKPSSGFTGPRREI